MAWDTENLLLHSSIKTGDHAEELILDPDTQVESLIKGLVTMGKVVMGGCALFILGVEIGIVHEDSAAAWSIAWKGFLIFLVGTVFRHLFSVDYRVDFRARTISRSRRLLGWVQRAAICDFDGVHSLAIDSTWTAVGEGKTRRRLWKYGLVMILKGGTVIRLVNCEFENFSALLTQAQDVATQVGVPLHAQGQAYLWVVPSAAGPEVALRDKAMSRGLGSKGCLILIALLLAGNMLSTILRAADKQARSPDSVPTAAAPR